MGFITHLINDATFWVMLSTLLCFGFIGWKAWRPIIAALDDRAAGIRQRLDEAEALRLEAEQILAEYKSKSANALKEAEDVLKNAEMRAEQMRKDMEAELKATIARQETNAKMRIARMENEAIDAVKSALIQAAVTKARDTIANDTDADDLGASLDAIGKTLH